MGQFAISFPEPAFPSGWDTQRPWTNPKPGPGNPGSGLIVSVNETNKFSTANQIRSPFWRVFRLALALAPSGDENSGIGRTMKSCFKPESGTETYCFLAR